MNRMNDAENYAVVGLTHYNDMRDRLAVLEYENHNLRDALNSAVASHQEVQAHINDDNEVEES